MLNAALAFIPLLAGYIFVTTWHETRYLIKREDSQKIYFRAAHWGIWIFLVALSCVTLLKPDLNLFLSFLSSWDEKSILLGSNEKPANFAFWGVVLTSTLVLGLISGYALNWVRALFAVNFSEILRLAVRRIKKRDTVFWGHIYEYSNRAALKKAVNILNSDLDLILIRALEVNMPICATLSNGKVYVGYVTGAIDPGDKKDMLRILPFVSGYRSGDSMKLQFTTWYVSIYQKFSENETLSHLNPELFEVVFPLCEIRTVNLFDIHAYQAFQDEHSDDASSG